jgi:hypothetical protein
MPAFFAKRGTTMPPNVRDDHSELGSDASTLKMHVDPGADGTLKPMSKLHALGKDYR